jgi:hypothetical protein
MDDVRDREGRHGASHSDLDLGGAPPRPDRGGVVKRLT